MPGEETLSIDGMLSHVGDFSCYQGILMLLFSIINILSAFHYFGQTFISLVPEYKCNSTENSYQRNESEECTVFITKNNTLITEPCRTGWIYSNENLNGYVSIVQELDWICKNAWKPALGQSMFFVGSVLGGIVFGFLADNIGRLHTLVLANMFALGGNVLTILSTNVTLFAISRLCAGIATDTNFVMMYIIVMEYIRPSMRTIGLNICIGVFYTVSCMIIPWIAALVGTWRTFLIIVAVPHIIVLLFYTTVPESAQWLLSKGRIEEAIKCFREIARINHKIITDRAINGLKNYCKQHIQEEKHEHVLGLFKTPNLRRKTLILIYKSMVLTLCYDAVSKNVNGVGLSPYVIFSITSSTILPACLLILAVQDKIGRKLLASSSLLISGIFAVGSGVIRIFTPETQPWVILTLAIVTRLGINTAYNSGHQYALELLPTVVRGQGVSVVHVAGYGATFFSSYILYLSNFWKPAPEIVLGVLMVSGAMACLFLPETLNTTLPVTLQDGEQFGENERIWDFSLCRTRSNKNESITTLEDMGVDERDYGSCFNRKTASKKSRG